MDLKDLKLEIELQASHIHRISNKPIEETTAVDLLDIAVSCKCLLLELRKHGIEV